MNNQIAQAVFAAIAACFYGLASGHGGFDYQAAAPLLAAGYIILAMESK